MKKLNVKDRSVQYANRYRLRDASRGTELGTYDFEEAAGTVTEEGTEVNKALFDIIDDNFDELDTGKLDKNGNIGETTSAVAENATAEAIESGEKTSTIFGKIKAWLAKLKALAFKDKVETDDITDKAITREKVSDDLIGQFKVEDATTTVKGIATLGSAGGAATYESVDELVKSKGQADGLATLGADGKIPDDQLPDDIGYTLPVATDTRLGGVMGYNPSEVASDAVESHVMVNPLGQMAAFVPIANHTTIGCVKSSPSGRTGTRCDVEINDDGTMMVYVPNSGGGGGSAILQKTIDNSSSNVSEVKSDTGSTVTVTDADVTATCHVDIYPTDTATEQFLLTALSTNIVAVSNGSFTLPLLQPLPAEWAMYYTITEVI